MTRDEARQLLGGYATGSLTESERKALFEAALDDQELFEELAGEQDLKEILALPGAKERLAAAVTTAGVTTMSAPEEKKKRAWWLFALAGVASVALLVWVTTSKNADAPVEVATSEAPSPEIPAPKLVEPPELSPAVDAALRADKEAEARKLAEAEKSARAQAPKVTAPKRTAPQEKTEIAAQVAPLPSQSVAAPKPAVAANGFVAGADPAATAEMAQLRDAQAKGRAAAVRPDAPPVRAGALTYVLTGRGSLKVTPAVSGSLEVTAGDKHIIEWDPVVADSTVEMPVPAGVDSLTLRFAVQGQQPQVVQIPIR